MDSHVPLNSQQPASAHNAPVPGDKLGITADTLSPASPSGSLVALMRRRPVISFFALTYVIAWLGWTPFVLSRSGLGVLPIQADPLILLGGFGPFAAGLMMAAITGGKAGARDLLSRLIRWRAGPQWYLFVLVGVPVVSLLGFLALPGVAATLNAPSLEGAGQFGLAFLAYLIQVSILQGLGEEPGWRGFALPRLQARYGPLVATLIIGSVWACYHLPLFLTTAFSDRTPMGFVYFLLASLAISCVLTWVFNSTRGSLLLTLLAHGAIIASGIASAATSLFPQAVLDRDTYPAITIGLGVVMALVILVTRGRLGWAPQPE